MLLRSTSSRIPAEIMANRCRGVWSMSAPEGHDPPHVPHCKQVISVSAPGVVAMTSAMKLSSELGPCMRAPRYGSTQVLPRPEGDQRSARLYDKRDAGQ